VAYRFGDAQLTLRAAGRGIPGVVVARHFPIST
jgi:hypothetical protein